MLPSLISINVILCEKILYEQDRLYSAVRISDVFYFRRNPSIPIESQPVSVCILVMGKTQPGDTSEHQAQIVITRPDGQENAVGEPLCASFEAALNDEGIAMLADASQARDIAGGFAVRAEVNIVPRQTGRHMVEVLIDGESVAVAPFTILELKPVVTG